jgi:transcriptional regulator with XRE-family HTH domain
MLDTADMKLSQYLSVNHISAKDFADRMGISQEAVRLYVVGKRRPRAALMAKIAHETGGMVTANDFFGDEETADEPSEAPPPAPDEEAA